MPALALLSEARTAEDRVESFLSQPIDDILAGLPAFVDSLTGDDRRSFAGEIDIVRLHLVAVDRGRGFDAVPGDENYYACLLDDAAQMVADRAMFE